MSSSGREQHFSILSTVDTRVLTHVTQHGFEKTEKRGNADREHPGLVPDPQITLKGRQLIPARGLSTQMLVFKESSRQADRKEHRF